VPIGTKGFAILERLSHFVVFTSSTVKFWDPVTNISCDMNINDRLGILNTALINHYCDLLPVLRPLLRSIKSWARQHDLNSPSSPGKPPTFSSYSLALMTIGFFQVRVECEDYFALNLMVKTRFVDCYPICKTSGIFLH
jgi:DNA polymerase sigma